MMIPDNEVMVSKNIENHSALIPKHLKKGSF